MPFVENDVVPKDAAAGWWIRAQEVDLVFVLVGIYSSGSEAGAVFSAQEDLQRSMSAWPRRLRYCCCNETISSTHCNLAVLHARFVQ